MSEATGKKVWDLLLKLTVPLSLVVGSAMIAHEVRLTRIEANRFTASDGAQLVVEMREYVNKHTAPPAWLRDDLLEIKTYLREIDKRLRALEAK